MPDTTLIRIYKDISNDPIQSGIAVALICAIASVSFLFFRNKIVKIFKKIFNKNEVIESPSLDSPNLFWTKEYAIKKIQFIVTNFKFNWDRLIFTSNIDFSKGKKLLDELEADLENTCNNLDSEVNNNSKQY